MLRHSHEFTTLPSERSPVREQQSLAARTLAKLAHRAIAFGPHGWTAQGDSARAKQDALRRAIGRGDERVELNWHTRPGAMIQDQPDETRAVLRGLTSEEASILPPDFDPIFMHDCAMHPRPGKRYAFGPMTGRFPADPTGWAGKLLVDEPRIFYMGRKAGAP